MKHTRVKLTVFTLAVAIILAMVLTACGSEAGTQTNAPVSSSTSDSTLPASVTDVYGRTVELPEEINSTVCLGAGALRMVCYAQGEDKVIGVEEAEHEQTLAKAYNYLNYDKFKDLPIVGQGGSGGNTPYEEEIIKDSYGKPIRVKTLGQKIYVDSVKNHDIVFGIGPAGTGKTFLAVTLAVTALKRGQVKRIVLTRPAVEAGESLGFLPGDLKEKVDPYLRPVYDALYQILGKEQTTRLMEREIIEIAPLAYMRGRTLEDAFVILDEAQNTTIMQMKMFLTRLGFNSKMIVNGDMSQIDLPRRVKSGLVDAMEKLKGIKAIDFVHFSASDVVRHPVVADIINAYEKDAPKVDFEEKSEETNKLEEETASGLTEYPVIGAEDLKK